MEEYLEFAKKIGYKAREIMLKYFNRDDIYSYKEDLTIVTVADKEINNYLIGEVRKNYKDHAVLGEEESYGSSDFVWVCDPIDGTAMYARGIRVAVFSLALVYKGEVILSLVMDPFSDNLYTALKGKGAYKNDKRIYVNEYSLSAKESVSNFDMFKESSYDLYDVVRELNKKSYFVSIGSVVHAGVLVAEGSFTCAIFPGTKNKSHDIAAIKLLVEEAGGKVMSIKGCNQDYDKDIDGAIICNEKAYDELFDIIDKNIKETL